MQSGRKEGSVGSTKLASASTLPHPCFPGNVQGCARLCKAVQGCPRLCKAVQGCARLCKQAKGKMPGQRLVGKQASQSQGLATWLAALCKVGKGKKEKKKSKKGKEKEKKGKDENRKRGKVPGQGLPGNTVGCSVV